MGEGRQIGIPYARGRHCPIRSLEAWLKLLPDSPGPIFRPVIKSGKVGDKRLSTEAVSKIVKGAVASIGLDPAKYSGHSLRAGLATSAAMHGVSALAIRRQTSHASDSMLARYVHTGELFVNNAASLLF
ncbi:tyrosine-type recombinase/integrase [Hwanghaeella sp. LZ110]|uniref:tyrosine-type recombinase/integrase n=1 Tax=Hwanghaeella sp. LZ110 TaxID=3402810 RepID=UPI003B67AE87